jgi:hypothetical protein
VVMFTPTCRPLQNGLSQSGVNALTDEATKFMSEFLFEF